ncbi:hypothetical protein AFL01nite_04820 [Aeromicrobium flavum]|uniref:Uncharacterized protein n=1 Tax=Aeromicrobium flavum TaxID=416568 RepID=A0A512HRS5_9ACTN|nr:hypothetical protein [Aeromicrobium flavum]GEO88155.1 hypothetical protein AFL01nite_04820 [Aeromicrobium flavum]
MAEMHRFVPFPYEGNRFPSTLGAVVQRTVLDGEHPAREVIHTPEGDWCIGDGVNDPNLPGASIATHISHAVEQNTSLASLASMPHGHIASRSNPGWEWQVQALTEWDDH